MRSPPDRVKESIFTARRDPSQESNIFPGIDRTSRERIAGYPQCHAGAPGASTQSEYGETVGARSTATGGGQSGRLAVNRRECAIEAVSD